MRGRLLDQEIESCELNCKEFLCFAFRYLDFMCVFDVEANKVGRGIWIARVLGSSLDRAGILVVDVRDVVPLASYGSNLDRASTGGRRERCCPDRARRDIRETSQNARETTDKFLTVSAAPGIVTKN